MQLHLLKPKTFVVFSFGIEILKLYYDWFNVTIEELVVGKGTLVVGKDDHAGLEK